MQVTIYYIHTYDSVAPSISSLTASSSTQLIITLTAPARSSSLTYKCTISTNVSGLSPKTVTDTVLQYSVDGLSPYVTYTVECSSSNGEDSCDSNMDTIRMPSDGEFFLSQLRMYRDSVTQIQYSNSNYEK